MKNAPTRMAAAGPVPALKSETYWYHLLREYLYQPIFNPE